MAVAAATVGQIIDCAPVELCLVHTQVSPGSQGNEKLTLKDFVQSYPYTGSLISTPSPSLTVSVQYTF